MSFWNTHAIEWKDLPTVRKLLREADMDLLAQTIVDEFIFSDDTPSNRVKVDDRKKYLRRIKKAIVEMRQRKIKKSKDVCIFPLRTFRFDPCKTTMRYSIDPWPIVKDMFGRASAQLKNAPALASPNDLRKFREKDKEAMFSELPFEHFAPIAIPFESWKEVLGYRVWLGGDFSRKELYMTLASIVWELTEFGFSEERAKKNRKKFEKSLWNTDKKGKKEKCYPGEVVIKDYHLKPEPDNLESEFVDKTMEIECILSHNELLAMCQQIARLNIMLKRGYRTCG